MPYFVSNRSDTEESDNKYTPDQWSQFVSQVDASRKAAEAASAQASKSAAQAAQSLSDTKQVESNVIYQGSTAVQNIQSSLSAATASINAQTNQSLSAIQSKQDEAVAAISEQVSEAQKSASLAAQYASNAEASANAAAENASKVQQEVESGISAIGDATESAKSEIQTAKTAAVDAVNQTKTQAVSSVITQQNSSIQAVQAAQNTAVQAVQTAQTTAVGAVNAAGNAKIEQIEQINALVPTPTPEDAGKVVVVKPDGTGYELGDAGSEIDDEVVAPDSTWSSKETASRIYQMREVSGAIVRIDDALPEFPTKVTAEAEVTRCGKNLCPYGTQTFETFYDVPFGFFLPPGEYTFSGLVTSNDTASNESQVYLYDTEQKKGINTFTIKRGARQSVSVNANAKFNAAFLYAGSTYPNSEGKTATFTDVQLELGSAATAYEAFSKETFPAGTPIMPLDGVNTIFAASGGVAVGYASKVKAPINDAQVSSLNTWSAQKLVDTLCPPFSVAGDVVQFAPIEGYPLSVKSTIVATQSGDGDPSPTNVRPIIPVNQVGVWAGGKNLCPYGSPTFTGYYQASFGFFIPAGTYVFSVLVTTDDADYDNNLVYFFNTKTGKGVVSKTIKRNVRQDFFVSVPDKFDAIYLYASAGAQQSVGKTATFSDIQLEVGSAATAYEPYRGQLYTAQLDEPCYGGTVDLTGGTGQIDYLKIEIADSSKVNMANGSTIFYTSLTALGFGDAKYKPTQNVASAKLFMCDRLKPVQNVSDTSPYGEVAIFENGIIRMKVEGVTSQQGARDWITANPVAIAYKLATPNPFKIDSLSIPAPASPATAYSTAGEITVEGRSDPIEYINRQIANAIAIAKA